MRILLFYWDGRGKIHGGHEEKRSDKPRGKGKEKR